MATNFPGSIDSLTDPTSSSPLNNPSHSGQHANANDAIVAIETAIGTTGAPVLASVASVTAETNRAEAAEASKLPLAGGTMTGPITGFEDKGGQVFNVKAYGATGNGSTDDTTAINAAVTAAAGVGGGGVVYFPPGTYMTTGISVPYSYLTLAGSRGATLELISSTVASLLSTPNDGTQRNGLRIFDLVFNGNGNNQSGTTPMIDIYGMDDFFISRCVVGNPRGQGLRFGAAGSKTCLNPYVTDCLFRDYVASSQSAAIELDSQSSDAHIINCDIGGYANGPGILLSGHFGSEIIGCDVWQCEHGYQLYSGNRTRLVGCLADYSGIYGYFIQQSSDLQFSACTARESSQNSHNTYEGFHFEGSSGSALTSNVSLVGCRAMGTYQSYGVNVLQYVSGFSWSSGSLVGNVTKPATIGATGNANIKFNHVIGLNPAGATIPGSAFAIGASTVAATNNTGVDGTLYVTAAGTVTAVSVNGVAVSGVLAVGDTYRLAAGGTFTMTYTVAPTVVFVGD
jgi:hypothetical protein